MEDLGYQVNYGAADAFTAAEMDSSCRCNNVQARPKLAGATGGRTPFAAKVEEGDVNEIESSSSGLINLDSFLVQSDNLLRSINRNLNHIHRIEFIE